MLRGVESIVHLVEIGSFFLTVHPRINDAPLMRDKLISPHRAACVVVDIVVKVAVSP